MPCQLKEHLWAKRMSQKKLAELTGLRQAYISSVTRGSIEPTIYRALAIALALKMSVAELWILPKNLSEQIVQRRSQ